MATLGLADVGLTGPVLPLPKMDYVKEELINFNGLPNGSPALNIAQFDNYSGQATEDTNAKFMAVHLLNSDGSQYEGSVTARIVSNTGISLYADPATPFTGTVVAMIADNTNY